MISIQGKAINARYVSWLCQGIQYNTMREERQKNRKMLSSSISLNCQAGKQPTWTFTRSKTWRTYRITTVDITAIDLLLHLPEAPDWNAEATTSTRDYRQIGGVITAWFATSHCSKLDSFETSINGCLAMVKVMQLHVCHQAKIKRTANNKS